jgi:protein AroM
VIPRLAAISIGQAPRPDLLEPLRSRLPDDRATIIEVGALDAVDPADLPPPAADGYPLGTRLRDGTSVVVDETFLAPLVQSAVHAAEHDGCIASVLLCAGGFAEVTAARPLIRPFELAVAALTSIGVDRIVAIVPTSGQVEPARRKWAAAGFAADVLAARLGEVPGLVGARGDHARVGTVVLDYVGHPTPAVVRLRELTGLPILDLGDLAAGTLAAMVS